MAILNSVIIGYNNGLSPVGRQAWISVDLM